MAGVRVDEPQPSPQRSPNAIAWLQIKTQQLHIYLVIAYFIATVSSVTPSPTAP